MTLKCSHTQRSPLEPNESERHRGSLPIVNLARSRGMFCRARDMQPMQGRTQFDKDRCQGVLALERAF